MPELPEVETVRLQLQKYLIGHKITDVDIRYGKKFEGNPKKIIGGKIVDVRRFGKAQSIDLDNGWSILVHIKLTGQLIYRGPKLKTREKLSEKITGGLGGKHSHIIFKLNKNGTLYFNDVRKFGWIRLIRSKDVTRDKFIANLGPEPIINKNNLPMEVLTLEKFKEILTKTSRAVKVVLMDQSKMGGVGNIYANDALWLSKINPKKAAKELDSKEAKELFGAIHEVLKSGLKYGGASELAFVTPDGSEGEYQDHTLVYGHKGEPCKRCKKTIIEKYFLSGRGTYWCPACQS